MSVRTSHGCSAASTMRSGPLNNEFTCLPSANRFSIDCIDQGLVAQWNWHSMSSTALSCRNVLGPFVGSRGICVRGPVPKVGNTLLRSRGEYLKRVVQKIVARLTKDETVAGTFQLPSACLHRSATIFALINAFLTIIS